MSMARDPKDVSGLRLVRTELAKRGIDTGKADIRVTHGTVYLRGRFGTMKGSNIPDLRREMDLIGQVLRQKTGIKDVVIDCQYSN